MLALPEATTDGIRSCEVSGCNVLLKGGIRQGHFCHRRTFVLSTFLACLVVRVSLCSDLDLQPDLLQNQRALELDRTSRPCPTFYPLLRKSQGKSILSQTCSTPHFHQWRHHPLCSELQRLNIIGLLPAFLTSVHQHGINFLYTSFPVPFLILTRTPTSLTPACH